MAAAILLVVVLGGTIGLPLLISAVQGWPHADD